MFRKSFWFALAAVLAAALLSAGSASAATTVGNACQPNALVASTQATVVGIANGPGDMMPAATPAGVITSWTVSEGAVPTGTQDMVQLKVLRHTPVAKRLAVVGESTPSIAAPGLNTYPTRIPVEAGDLLGLTGTATVGTTPEPHTNFCTYNTPGEIIGAGLGAPSVGGTLELLEEQPGGEVPVTVAVEPDADGDGFGDETQDQCASDASTQGACPAALPGAGTPGGTAGGGGSNGGPNGGGTNGGSTGGGQAVAPIPLTLGASAAARHGFVTVSLTASAQTNVTVGGSVSLGKGKATRLSGGTQTVAPGSLAKFTVLLPAKVKAALARMSPHRKLTLTLTASAPGATKRLTVKVAGEKAGRTR
jgi:hypothetical protein